MSKILLTISTASLVVPSMALAQYDRPDEAQIDLSCSGQGQ